MLRMGLGSSLYLDWIFFALNPKPYVYDSKIPAIQQASRSSIVGPPVPRK